ncbi:hypothetical protein TEA_010525 [Camellia sinensis var. sinensis]|uniref:Uncharacterized protein n=1 Tax=Camellia sinensis var. sinensis TaxID=542762 RepID=A0A4S4EJP3_CAMSN|nr:hypothetical protein TEA_010525 [Camellia sinensis var. sinensis]
MDQNLELMYKIKNHANDTPFLTVPKTWTSSLVHSMIMIACACFGTRSPRRNALSLSLQTLSILRPVLDQNLQACNPWWLSATSDLFVDILLTAVPTVGTIGLISIHVLVAFFFMINLLLSWTFDESSASYSAYILSTARLKKLSYCLSIDHCDPVLVFQKVYVGVYNGVTTSKLDELSTKTADAMTTNHPNYASVSFVLKLGL